MKKSLFHGVLGFERKRGYLIPRRFTREQMEAVSYSELYYDRTRCPASVTLELSTEATEITLAYKIFFRTPTRSTFEVYVNGFLTHIVQDESLPDEGKVSFSFKEGEKQIEIYIPNYCEIGIKDFTVNGDYRAIPRRKSKVLFLGDSITQGGGSRRSAQTYVNVLKRELNYEIVNHGIGGIGFEKRILTEIPFVPTKIVVALGTNHYGCTDEENRERIGGFFEALAQRYGGVKTLVVLPPYCANPQFEDPHGRYKKIAERIAEAAAGHPNTSVVNAYGMIPHLADYYLEDMVHPNALGMELYGQNLVKAIRKIRF